MLSFFYLTYIGSDPVNPHFLWVRCRRKVKILLDFHRCRLIILTYHYSRKVGYNLANSTGFCENSRVSGRIGRSDFFVHVLKTCTNFYAKQAATAGCASRGVLSSTFKQQLLTYIFCGLSRLQKIVDLTRQFMI